MIRIINDTKIIIYDNFFSLLLLLASAKEVFLLYYSHNKNARRLSILCIKTKITSVSIITTIASVIDAN